MPAPTKRRPISEILNPDLIKRAKDEYNASLPRDRSYAQALTKTKYGGTFGDSRGRGFDAWFEENYINNPNSALSSQERMSLQPYVGVPRYQMDSIGQRPQVSPGNYNDLMARQTYDNIMRDQMARYAAQQASASNSQFLPGVPPPPAPAVPQVNQQAASNFANLTPGASMAGQQPSQPKFSQPKPSQPFAQPAAPFGGQRPRQSRAQAPNVGFAPIQAF